MGIRLGIGKAHRTRDRGQGHVGLKGLNDVELGPRFQEIFQRKAWTLDDEGETK